MDGCCGVTVEPRYNAPRHNANSDITRSRRGSRNLVYLFAHEFFLLLEVLCQNKHDVFVLCGCLQLILYTIVALTLADVYFFFNWTQKQTMRWLIKASHSLINIKI